MLRRIYQLIAAPRALTALASLQLPCLGCDATVELEDGGTGGGAAGGNGPTTASSGATAASTSSSSTGVIYSEDETYSQLECEVHVGPKLFVEISPGELNGGCFFPNVPGTTIKLGIRPWDGLAGTYTIDSEKIIASVPELQDVPGGTLTVSVSQQWWPTEVILDFDPPFDYASGTAKLAVCSDTIGTNPCE